MEHKLFRMTLIGAIVVLGAACSSKNTGTRSDTGPADSGADSGPTDGGPTDGGPTDGGPTDTGAGDTGAGDTGAGDTGAGDAGPTASDMITAVLAAADGPTTLVIAGAWVTYLKPAVGPEGAGFALQADMAGPALYVDVDPATLTPSPVVGDALTLTVDSMGTSGGQRRATAVSALMVTSMGNDVTTLIQDVSAATDLVAALDSYTSELVGFDITVTGTFGFAGTAHSQAGVDTAGLVGDAALRVRVPEALLASLGLVPTCRLVVAGTPMWRFNATAQLALWTAADATTVTCPATQVTAATATSATAVSVTFDRDIDPASVLADGSQFTIPGLTVTGATVAGGTVTLTTSAQTGGTSYTVTVATTVMDVLGAALDAAANTATFAGFLAPAMVRINEVKANVTGGCDLIELRVTAGGSLAGFQVWERNRSIHTFPTFTVATNDYVVLHFRTGAAACNPASAVDETTAVDAQPAATHGNNFDTAFDFYMADPGMTGTDNVVTVTDPGGTIVEAAFFSDGPTGTAAAGSETQAAVVAVAGEWTMVGGGVPAGGFIDGDFNLYAVQNLAGADTIQRINDLDTNTRDDWTTTNAVATWGANNVGQINL